MTQIGSGYQYLVNRSTGQHCIEGIRFIAGSRCGDEDPMRRHLLLPLVFVSIASPWATPPRHSPRPPCLPHRCQLLRRLLRGRCCQLPQRLLRYPWAASWPPCVLCHHQWPPYLWCHCRRLEKKPLTPIVDFQHFINLISTFYLCSSNILYVKC